MTIDPLDTLDIQPHELLRAITLAPYEPNHSVQLAQVTALNRCTGISSVSVINEVQRGCG